MCAEAYLNDKKIYLTFESNSTDGNITIIDDISYNLGTLLTGFLRFDINLIDEMLDTIIKNLLNIKAGNSPYDYNELIVKTTRETSKKCPYLMFCSDILISVLLSLVTGNFQDIGHIFVKLPNLNSIDKKYSEQLEKFVYESDHLLEKYYDNNYLQDASPQQKRLLLKSLSTVLYIKDGILENIKQKRTIIDEALSFIFNDNSQNNDPLGLLYAFDKDRQYFLNTDFSVKLFPNEKYKIISEIYILNSIDDLIKFEITKVISGNINIKKCANCGYFFASYGRADTIYCDIALPNQKSCSEIGAIKKFKEKTASNPVFEEFNKAYKRNNAKFRSGKMDNFSEWSLEARKKRDLCLNGKLELSQYIEWLGNRK